MCTACGHNQGYARLGLQTRLVAVSGALHFVHAIRVLIMGYLGCCRFASSSRANGIFLLDGSYSNKPQVCFGGIMSALRLPILPLAGYPLRPLAPHLLRFPPLHHSGLLHSSFRSLYDYHHPQSALLRRHRTQPHHERLLVG
jgi:hypothetical protein